MKLPPGRWWYVVPSSTVDLEVVRHEVEGQGIPGLCLPDAEDRDLQHLAGLTGLKYLDLRGTHVTYHGMAYLKGLTGLQILDLRGSTVTYPGLQ